MGRRQLKTYNPLEIFQEKRRHLKASIEKASRAQDKQEAAQLNANGEAELVEGTGPEWESLKYLKEGIKSVEQILHVVQNMHDCCKKAMDESINDVARKPLNFEFMRLRRDLDRMIDNAAIGNERPFAGKYSKTPKKLQIGPEEQEVINIIIPNMNSRGLALNRISLDTFVAARKATTVFDDAVKDVKALNDLFKNKSSSIQWKLAQAQRRDRDEKDAEAREAERERNEQTSRILTKYDMIRKRQEKAAEAKGRELGLLTDFYF